MPDDYDRLFAATNALARCLSLQPLTNRHATFSARKTSINHSQNTKNAREAPDDAEASLLLTEN
jgi:hypothetical protein